MISFLDRYAHSDIPLPDFKDDLKPDKKPLDSNENRKCLNYAVSFGRSHYASQ